MRKKRSSHTDFDPNISFARLQRESKDKRNLAILKCLNILLMLLSGGCLLVKTAMFAMIHWYINVCLFLQIVFLTLNICMVLLNPESQRFWLQHKLYTCYIPYGIVTSFTIIEIGFFWLLIDKRIQ
jgi:hypothetical protein